MTKARELAELIGVSGTSEQVLAGRKNLIINGAMQVAQRGTSATGVTSGGYKTCDRWGLNKAGSAVFTIEQSTDAPADFDKSFKTTVTTGATLGSTEYGFYRYFFEGQDVAHLNWGTSNAKTVTLSFWVKSSITGNHPLLIGRQTQMVYPVTYTVNAANTWEYKTVTFAGPTSGTFGTGTSAGWEIMFDVGTGTTYSATAGSWTTGNYFGVTGAVKLSETTGATWAITGVQLEVGSVATPFEHRSYGEELALCQRYYEVVGNGAPALANSSTQFWTGYTFKTEKRANPTVSILPSTLRYFKFGIANRDNSSPNISNAYYGTASSLILVNGWSGLTANESTMTGGSTTDSSAKMFAFDAEL